VRRGGEVVTTTAENVVVGDVLILVPGARLSADAKLLRVVDFGVDESALTGESLPVEKSMGCRGTGLSRRGGGARTTRDRSGHTPD